ncbi:glutathione S-transferase family protein [Cystobacter fuscus]|nr:glutathione S-transferase family protein [Cystobacter fuscus]
MAVPGGAGTACSRAMPHPDRTLYQFPISHFCEKTRWNLDAKAIPYGVRNLLPGVHARVTKRLTGGHSRSVPVLVDRGTPLSDSTDIALHLESAYPSAPRLIPSEGPERERVLELEAYYDETAGVHVRRWVYAKLLDEEADVSSLLFGAFPLPVRLLGRAMFPLVKKNIQRHYVQSPEMVEASRVKLLEGIERLEREIQGDPARYLVGDRLSIADITAAALYAPLMGPEGSPYAPRRGKRAPRQLERMREELLTRPAGQWFVRRYREDRQRLARGFPPGADAPRT